MNRDNVAGFGIGILAGAAIGGVIALLYAPRSGKETRELLKSKAVETAGNVRDFATDTADRVKFVAAEAGRKGEAVVHAVKN